MEIVASIVLQAVFVGLALVVTVLRCWIRLGLERRSLTLPDYLIWAGWLCTLGWFTCSIIALRLQLDHPLVEPDLTTDSVKYLETVFIASYFFDVGLYFPKASLIAFYWWLIPHGFRRYRVGIYVSTAYIACAFAASLLTDTLIAGSISNNWSVENQLLSLWNSLNAFIINWCLNWSTDILLFILPFFIISSLTLRKSQKLALCGVFCLGLITIVISLSRFIAYVVTDYNIDDAAGNLWCTAEICTATIVVSLPALKVLIIRSTPANTSNRSTNGYIKTGPKNPFSHGGTHTSHIEAGDMGDDEIELVLQGSRKSSLSPIRSGSAMGAHDTKNAVTVTTNFTVTRDVL